MLKSRKLLVLPPNATLPDGYYSYSLAMLTTVIGICRQAGILVPEQNDTKETNGVELEGIFYQIGPGREFSCRAARDSGAEHKTDAGAVVSERTGKLDGRAEISVLYEPTQRKWSLYAQVMPGCRTEEMKTLCNRLSVDIATETKRETSEDEAFTMILSIAKWAAEIIAANGVVRQ